MIQQTRNIQQLIIKTTISDLPIIRNLPNPNRCLIPGHVWVRPFHPSQHLTIWAQSWKHVEVVSLHKNLGLCYQNPRIQNLMQQSGHVLANTTPTLKTNSPNSPKM